MPPLVDDYEKILVHLANGRASLDELHKGTGLSRHALNGLVLDLRCKGRVALETERVKGQGKVNFYSLKLKGAA